MTRSGLLVPAQVLTAAENLAAHCRARLWGMSPFGGDTQDPIWREVDPRQFLNPGQESTRWQAALRLALAVPDGWSGSLSAPAPRRTSPNCSLPLV